MVDPTSSPQLEFILELRVNIGPTLELGHDSFGIQHRGGGKNGRAQDR
jgi:hypothetical protein